MPHVLLRPHWLGVKNRLRHHSVIKGRNRQLFVIGIVVLGIMLCMYAVAHLLLAHISFNQEIRIELVSRIVDLTTYSMFWLLLTSTTISSIGNFYLAENNTLFFGAPLSKARLFFAKYLETYIETTIMLAIFSVPILLALHHDLAVSWFRIVGLVGISIIFLTIPTSFGVILGTFGIHLLQFLWHYSRLVLAVAIVLACLITARILNFIVIQTHNDKSTGSILNQLDNPNHSWLPSYWLSETLKPLLFGAKPDIHYFALVIVMSAVAILFALGTYVTLRDKSREAGTACTSENNNSSHSKESSLYWAIHRFAGILHQRQEVRAFTTKDLVTVLRDKTQAIQLLLLLGFAGIYLTIFRSLTTLMNLQQVSLQLWSASLATMNVLFTGVLITTVMTRLVFPSLSLEGRSYSLLQVAPVSIEELLRLKLSFWSKFTSAISVSIMTTGLIALNPPAIGYCFGIIVSVLIAITYSRLAIGLGALYAKFDWESVNQIYVSFGTLSLFLISLCLTVGITLGAMIPFFLIFTPELTNLSTPFWTITILMMSIAAIFIFPVSLCSFFYKKGIERLQITESI